MPRRYDNRSRAERAAGTRRRVIDAAADSFRERGYSGTRMSDIAARAGVSTDTVNVNGPKSALLQAAVEVTSFGREGEHLVFEFDLGADILRQVDAEAFASLLAGAMVSLNARVASLWAVLAAESLVDPELRARHDAMIASIIRSADAVVALGEERGWVLGDRDRRERVATILAVGSTDSYRRVHDDLGLGDDGYREWLRRGILAALGH
ncbi:TetR/AcrR family transcriptional regulator [Agromyces sp. SYSU T00266]|uniref:TetR/AcrR family transcriptional regulator n=1 Tax=Agromyces zhanjiangensis TaxID=3158562 RepID=UPI003392A61A